MQHGGHVDPAEPEVAVPVAYVGVGPDFVAASVNGVCQLVGGYSWCVADCDGCCPGNLRRGNRCAVGSSKSVVGQGAYDLRILVTARSGHIDVRAVIAVGSQVVFFAQGGYGHHFRVCRRVQHSADAVVAHRRNQEDSCIVCLAHGVSEQAGRRLRSVVDLQDTHVVLHGRLYRFGEAETIDVTVGRIDAIVPDHGIWR